MHQKNDSMTLKFTLILLLATSFTFSQRGRREANPVFHEISNKAVVQSVYPEAVKVEKVNDFWYQVLDKNNRVIGFAISSVPHCSDIIGYNGSIF